MTRALTGRSVLLWFIAFFGLIFVINGYYISIAVKTFSGEDEQKPYLQGIEYNDTLARRAEQRKLGWRATLSAQRLAAGHVLIVVDLLQADGSPETKVSLSGELRHPSNENLDHALVLKEVSPGRYEADLAGVSAGTWDIIVSTAAREAPFEVTRRVWVP